MRPRLLLPAIFSLLAAAGCAWRAPIRDRLPDRVHRPDRPVVLFFVDGLDPAVLDSLARAGRTPQIKRHLLDRGVQIDHAVTVTPSITFAVNVSLATGQCPGHHGILGNTWFDRDRLIFENYNGVYDYQRVDSEFNPPTVFERAVGRQSATVLTPVHRGSTRHYANWLSTGVTWFFGTLEQVDALTAYRTGQVVREAAAVGRWPDVLWLYFPGVDHIGHHYGKNSPQYADAVVNIDTQVGRVIDVLARAGLYERTLLVFVADHGQEVTDPAHVNDLAGTLRRMGLNVVTRSRDSGEYPQRHARLANKRVALIDDGNRRAAVHLRVGTEWSDRPTLGQVERFGRDFGGARVRHNPAPFWDICLATMPPGHLAAVRTRAGEALVTDGVGRAVVERRIDPPGPGGIAVTRTAAEWFRYTVTSRPDPIRLADHAPARALLDGQFHSSADWLNATCDAFAPDFVAQIVDYFDSPRSGDIVFFSTGPWQFAEANRGGHGGPTAADMHIPLIFAGAGLPAGRIRTARLVDVTPTLLEYLGATSRPASDLPMDGVSRWRELSGIAGSKD